MLFGRQMTDVDHTKRFTTTPWMVSADTQHGATTTVSPCLNPTVTLGLVVESLNTLRGRSLQLECPIYRAPQQKREAERPHLQRYREDLDDYQEDYQEDYWEEYREDSRENYREDSREDYRENYWEDSREDSRED